MNMMSSSSTAPSSSSSPPSASHSTNPHVHEYFYDQPQQYTLDPLHVGPELQEIYNTNDTNDIFGSLPNILGNAVELGIDIPINIHPRADSLNRHRSFLPLDEEIGVDIKSSSHVPPHHRPPFTSTQHDYLAGTCDYHNNQCRPLIPNIAPNPLMPIPVTHDHEQLQRARPLTMDTSAITINHSSTHQQDNDQTIKQSDSPQKIRILVKTKELNLVDDYSWRKYGEKVIKKSGFPRSYFRCVVVGCPARKHVERCSNNAKFVMITYIGIHHHH